MNFHFIPEKLRGKWRERSPGAWILLVVIVVLLWPFWLCFLLVGLILFGTLAAVIFPFEYPKYRRSRFYQAFGARYVPLMTMRDEFKIYECLTAHENRIEFVRREDGTLYLQKDGVVYLLPWFYKAYCESDGTFMAALSEDDEDYEDLEKILEEETERIGLSSGSSVKVLVNCSLLFDERDQANAAKNDRVVLYRKPEELTNLL